MYRKISNRPEFPKLSKLRPAVFKFILAMADWEFDAHTNF